MQVPGYKIVGILAAVVIVGSLTKIIFFPSSEDAPTSYIAPISGAVDARSRLEKLARQGDKKARNELCFGKADVVSPVGSSATFDSCKKLAENGDQHAFREFIELHEVTDHRADCFGPDHWKRQYKANPALDHANLGYAPEMYGIGWEYYLGGHCSIDGQSFAEAYYWWSLASKRGAPSAEDDTDYTFWINDAERRLTSEEITSIKKRIAEWTPKPSRYLEPLKTAAEGGDVKAALTLWKLLDHGAEDVVPNVPEATKWLHKAAEQGNASAQAELGWRYHLGKGIQRDQEEAEKWTEKAIENGNKDSIETLASIYSENKDHVNAYFWFSLAANLGIDAANATNLKNRQGAQITTAQRADDDIRVSEWITTHSSALSKSQ